MKRSCGRASASASRRTTAAADAPGAISLPSSGATRARYCAVPWCSRTWSPERSGRAPGSTLTQASKRRPASAATAGAASQSPRATSSRSSPRRFTPTRLPACTTSASWSCTCTLRTPARAPPGTTTRPSPALISPDQSVPVTTVPMPLSGNTRSTGRRAGPAWRPASARLAVRSSAASRSSRPRPSFALTVTTSQPANGVPSRNCRTSSSASSSSSSSTRSALVSATTPSRTPSSSMMARCSHRLGHHAVVGGDDQQEEVDAGRAGDHGPDEALVARHVDHAQPGPGRQLQLGVAELDGDAALPLLAQAVGVLAGEARDERRLAVVDVAGGAEGERRAVGHGGLRRRAMRAAAASSWQLVLADGAEVEEQAAVVHAADHGRRAAAQLRGALVGLARRHLGRDGHARHLGHGQRPGAGAGDRLDELETVAPARRRRSRGHAGGRRGRAPRPGSARARPAWGSRRRLAAGSR